MKPKPLFIISDGTGDTAEKVVHACLLQFEGAPVQPQTFPHVQDAEQLRKLFRVAKEVDAFVVTTLVRGEHREEAARLAQQYRLEFVDIVGNMLSNLSNFLKVAPIETAGLLHRADARYFRRIAAVEFTVKADDGKEPRMLTEADIVLVGVSRTSKTPLSVFLAHKGYRVGNVPLVLDRDPPEQLWEVDSRRVFALTIDPESLGKIRKQRLEHMRMSDRTNYGQIDYILAELDFAHDLFDRNRDWPVIDVTNKAVEETAATILKVLAERGLATHVGDVGQL
ncbi:MAG: kinase/pyrophosphorylase [Proteobacteria bacterium]|nr:kinase/pyrophosphorylase [Pseudomonadota bacterium]MCP4919107.1 kinase/pyrophosphorylase [Pseudomonadota bacterium]